MPQKKSHQSARIMTGPGKATRPREQLRVLKSIPPERFTQREHVTQAQKIGAPGERPSGPAQRNYQIEYSRLSLEGPTRVAQPATRSSRARTGPQSTQSTQ